MIKEDQKGINGVRTVVKFGFRSFKKSEMMSFVMNTLSVLAV